MITYIALTKPFVNKLNLVEMLCYESCVLIVSGCTWILAELEEDPQSRDGVSEVIIGIQIGYSAIALAFMLIHLIQGIRFLL